MGANDGQTITVDGAKATDDTIEVGGTTYTYYVNAGWSAEEDATTVTSDGEKVLGVEGDFDAALNQVDSLRSELGAVQNRFEDAITNLSSARSRIEDADMTRAQIPQNVLSLLG